MKQFKYANLHIVMEMIPGIPPVLEDLNPSFHHVGVAVRSIEASLDFFIRILGCEQLGEPVDVPPQQVRVCFLRIKPGVKIELVEGLGENSPVAQLLQRIGAGTYHICYEVDNLDEALTRLRAERCRVIQSFEMPKLSLRRFAFLLSPERRLFELCQSEGAGS